MRPFISFNFYWKSVILFKKIHPNHSFYIHSHNSPLLNQPFLQFLFRKEQASKRQQPNWAKQHTIIKGKNPHIEAGQSNKKKSPENRQTSLTNPQSLVQIHAGPEIAVSVSVNPCEPYFIDLVIWFCSILNIKFCDVIVWKQGVGQHMSSQTLRMDRGFLFSLDSQVSFVFLFLAFGFITLCSGSNHPFKLFFSNKNSGRCVQSTKA